MPHFDKPLQFGIRHLLVTMIGVSLVAAVVAPWLRSWSREKWLAWGCHWGIALGVFAGWTVLFAFLNRHAEARSGAVHWRLPIRHHAFVLGRRFTVTRRRLILLWSLVLLGYLACETIFFAMINSGEPHWDMLIVFGFFVGMFLASLLRRPMTLHDYPIGIAEHGVVLRDVMCPWSFVFFHDGTADSPPWLGLKWSAQEFIVEPPENAEDLIEFLSPRAKRWDNPSTKG